jgi:mono/diheme cytochrome c family protein
MRTTALPALISLACAPAPEAPYSPDWAGTEALFQDACVDCHGAGGSASANITLPEDILTDLTEGTERWVVPGDASLSRLWHAVSGEGLVSRMPPGEPLDEAEILPLKAWIDAGAAVP